MTIILEGIVVLLLNNDYLYGGDVWQDTPEKALMQQANLTVDSKQTLTPETLLDTRYIDDIVIMTCVSKGDTLVNVTFITTSRI